MTSRGRSLFAPTSAAMLSWPFIKRALKIVLGFTLLPLGILMLALPGPGWLTIVLALAILAGEFVWARKLLDRLKQVGAKLDPRKRTPPT